MTTATKDIVIFRFGPDGLRNVQPVGDGITLFKGIMVQQDATDGGIQSIETVVPQQCVGVTTHSILVAPVATGDLRVEIEHDRIFIFTNSGTDAITEANTLLGADIFAEDDNTLGATDQTASLAKAGVFMGLEDDGRVRVYIDPRS